MLADDCCLRHWWPASRGKWESLSAMPTLVGSDPAGLGYAGVTLPLDRQTLRSSGSRRGQSSRPATATPVVSPSMAWGAVGAATHTTSARKSQSRSGRASRPATIILAASRQAGMATAGGRIPTAGSMDLEAPRFPRRRGQASRPAAVRRAVSRRAAEAFAGAVLPQHLRFCWRLCRRMVPGPMSGQASRPAPPMPVVSRPLLLRCAGARMTTARRMCRLVTHGGASPLASGILVAL